MNEYMGNICGVYDAKEEGFVPGGSSLHSSMVGHGPEAAVFEKASNPEIKAFTEPNHTGHNSIAFMFESTYLFKLTDYACKKENMCEDYVKETYGDLKKHFDPTKK